MEWFCYDGTGSPYNPLNFFPCTLPNCPAPKVRLCAIRADRQIIDGTPRPVITTQLQAQIAAALLTLVESANVLLEPAD